MIRLLEKYHRDDEIRWPILLHHSRMVANKAVAIARNLNHHQPVDITFVEEAALLHDIGIHLTDAPQIGCHGEHPYLMHGILGREILEREGLPRHALVCERHIGIGLSRADIIDQDLPLPKRDMRPLSIEEKIITYADLFFSKSAKHGPKERSLEVVRQRLGRHGDEKVAELDQWHELFSV
jgi:uncharacterized protein